MYCHGLKQVAGCEAVGAPTCCVVRVICICGLEVFGAKVARAAATLLYMHVDATPGATPGAAQGIHYCEWLLQLFRSALSWTLPPPVPVPRVLHVVYARAEGSCHGSHAGLFESSTRDHHQQLLWLLFVCDARHRTPDMHHCRSNSGPPNRPICSVQCERCVVQGTAVLAWAA